MNLYEAIITPNERKSIKIHLIAASPERAEEMAEEEVFRGTGERVDRSTVNVLVLETPTGNLGSMERIISQAERISLLRDAS